MYSVNLKNIVPKGGLTFLLAKATSDESKLWHRRLGHLNFKTKQIWVKVPQPSGPTDIVVDKAVHNELGDNLVRAVTTASSLEVEKDSGNITKTRSKATPNESSTLRTNSGGGPRCQETMGDTIAQTRRVESSGDEDSLGEDASKQGRRINAIDADEDITLVNVQDDAEMFDVNTLTGYEVNVVKEPVKSMKKKDLIRLDEETAKRLQAEFDEKERLAREKDEAKLMIEEWV
ncbi:hypothetical protein Tco_0343960 [Tanacetum coccineum]